MKGIKVEQFDPAHKVYIEHAWCAGPMDFRHADPRGHTRITKNDWIVTFLETGEHIVVTDATYQAYFAEPLPVASIVSKYLSSDPQLSTSQAPPATLAEADSKDWESSSAGPLAGQDSELGEPANDQVDSPGAELDAAESLDTGSGESVEARHSTRNKRRS